MVRGELFFRSPIVFQSVPVLKSGKKIYNHKKSHVVPRKESMEIQETIDAPFKIDDNALMSMLN